VFSRLFAGRRAELHVTTADRLKSGQAVRIGISSAALVRLAAVVYGLPVVVFILAAAATATLVPSGGLQDLLALCSGIVAASCAVLYAVRRRSRMLNPRLEVLSASAVCSPVETGHG
jgi:positive regulator of sigma E activity